MAPKNETAPVNTVTNFSHKHVATRTIRKIALTTAGGVKKPHPYRRGTIAAQQANNDHKSTELMIPEVSFPGSVAQEDQENCLGLGKFWVGFSFGNVDDAGNLEEAYFDEDAKEKLNALSQLCPSIVDLQSTELLVREDHFAGSVAHENGLGLKEFLVEISFGNVDDAGNLEATYFDEHAKEQLYGHFSQLCPSIMDLQEDYDDAV